jgi:hypothetical protein
MLCKFERNSKKKMMIRAATIGTHHSQCQQEGNGRSLQFQNVAGRCEGTVFGSNPGVRVRAFSKAV